MPCHAVTHRVCSDAHRVRAPPLLEGRSWRTPDMASVKNSVDNLVGLATDGYNRRRGSFDMPSFNLSSGGPASTSQEVANGSKQASPPVRARTPRVAFSVQIFDGVMTLLHGCLAPDPSALSTRRALQRSVTARARYTTLFGDVLLRTGPFLCI